MRILHQYMAEMSRAGAPLQYGPPAMPQGSASPPSVPMAPDNGMLQRYLSHKAAVGRESGIMHNIPEMAQHHGSDHKIQPNQSDFVDDIPESERDEMED